MGRFVFAVIAVIAGAGLATARGMSLYRRWRVRQRWELVQRETAERDRRVLDGDEAGNRDAGVGRRAGSH